MYDTEHDYAKDDNSYEKLVRYRETAKVLAELEYEKDRLKKLGDKAQWLLDFIDNH